MVSHVMATDSCSLFVLPCVLLVSSSLSIHVVFRRVCCVSKHNLKISPIKWPPAGYWCACIWPNCQKQTPWGRHEGPTSSSETCAHSPARCSSVSIHQRTLELASLPLAPRSLHRWERVHTEHWVSGVKASGDVVVNVMLLVTSSSVTSLVVGQWWSGDGRTDLHAIANGTLTAVRLRDELLSDYQTLGWCSGSGVPPGAGQWPASCGQSV